MYKVTVIFKNGKSRTRHSETEEMARFVKNAECKKREVLFWMITKGNEIIEYS